MYINEYIQFNLNMVTCRVSNTTSEHVKISLKFNMLQRFQQDSYRLFKRDVQTAVLAAQLKSQATSQNCPLCLSEQANNLPSLVLQTMEELIHQLQISPAKC